MIKVCHIQHSRKAETNAVPDEGRSGKLRDRFALYVGNVVVLGESQVYTGSACGGEHKADVFAHVGQGSDQQKVLWEGQSHDLDPEGQV